MKNPNGYGCVYKLSGKRRKPWGVKKTVGFDDYGKQLRVNIGYYRTRQEALIALAEYNNNPYDLKASTLTFNDVYEKWSQEKFAEYTNKSTRKNYTAAYSYCTALYNMKMVDIRPYHMQQVLDNCNRGYEMVKRTRILFNQLYVWCIQHDCIKKNYAQGLKVNVKQDSSPRKSFTYEEVDLLWNSIGSNEYVSIVLMLIYSGVRISELLNLKKEDVHLDEQWFSVKASKTDAGVRTVPIADKVLPFWKSFYERSKCSYAVCTINGEQLTYENFKKRYWKPLMDNLNLQHTIHETRHTCISLLTMKNANPTIIKKIVGHKSIMSLTERVYTHIEIRELINTINLI